MSKKIRVGVIGASPGQGWSSVAHIPALQALPDFEIVAVATSRRDSADKAAVALGVPAFTDAMDVARHPDVDLVAVTVKVPDHLDPTLAAIEAGKHVYCEWPLGRNSAEAIRMRDAAEAKGVKHAVGLQARMAPAVLSARALIQQGYVGDILSVTVITGTPGWGAVVDEGHVYMLDKEQGVTLLGIVGGHTFDALRFVLGDIRTLSASIAGRRPRVRVLETGRSVPQTTPDQIVVSGELTSGAPFVGQLRGGRIGRSDLLFEIIGTEGELAITSDGNIQMSELILSGAQNGGTLQPLGVSIDDAIGPLAGTPAYNVAQIYRSLANAINGRASHHPDFNSAVHNHALLDTIEKADGTGSRMAF